MHPSSMHYFPLTWPFLAILAGLFVLLVALIELQVLCYAYQQIGIKPRYLLLVLLLSLLGSYVNIPLADLGAQQVISDRVIRFGGVDYIVPTVHQWPGTVIAINVGGALVPAALSLFLLVRNRFYVRGLLATAVVALVVHHVAQPVQGIGITVSPLVPPVAACGVAMILCWRRAAPLAYIAGSLGTLIGADLMNLNKVSGLGAPIASIGGAGTFDGVFLAGILAVLLAPTSMRARPKPVAGQPPGDRTDVIEDQ